MLAYISSQLQHRVATAAGVRTDLQSGLEFQTIETIKCCFFWFMTGLANAHYKRVLNLPLLGRLHQNINFYELFPPQQNLLPTTFS